MAPAHVSSRYHQSLRNQLICKGTVVPTDDAKLMGAFSIDTGLELVGVAGPIRRAGSIYNLHRKGGPAGGVPAVSPMPKSVSFS